MSKEIVKVIEWKLKTGISKADIEKDLSLKYKWWEYKDIIANYPDADKKEKYKIINYILIFIIWLVALLKIPIILSLTANMNIFVTIIIFAVWLFIPYIIIKELLWFKHTWYYYVLMLNILGLWNFLIGDLQIVQNWLNLYSILFIFDLFISIFLIITSFYLIRKIYK